MSQTLLVEIRQAVNEAQPRGKMVIFNCLCFSFWFCHTIFLVSIPRDNVLFSVLFSVHNNYVSSSACLVKNVIPNSLSPPGTVPWQPARESYNQQGPPSPSSISSSGSTSPGYSPSRTLDLSGSSTSFSERKNAHHWQNGPVQEWTKEQVCEPNKFRGR